MRTYTVIDRKLLIEDSGVRFWFTREHITRHIEKLETDLAEWQRRLTLLGADPAETLETADQEQPAGLLKPGR